MSLAEQIQRVDGSQNDILKTLLSAFGVTVGENKIDQLAALAKAAPLLKENGILAADTKTSFGLSSDSTVNDVLAKLSNAASVGEGGGLVTAGGVKVSQLEVESGSYTGTGTTNEMSITSEYGSPLFVAITGGSEGIGIFINNSQNLALSTIYQGYGNEPRLSSCDASVAANELTWSGTKAEIQLNKSGSEYKYLILSLSNNGG